MCFVSLKNFIILAAADLCTLRVLKVLIGVLLTLALLTLLLLLTLALPGLIVSLPELIVGLPGLIVPLIQLLLPGLIVPLLLLLLPLPGLFFIGLFLFDLLFESIYNYTT